MSSHLLNSIQSANRGAKRYGTAFNEDPMRITRSNAFDNQGVRDRSMNGSRTDMQPPGVPGNILPFRYDFANREPNPFEQEHMEHEDSVNPRITPWGRIYRGIPTQGSEFQPPGVNDLSLVLRENPEHANIRFGGKGANAENMLVSGGSLFAATPLQWNLIMAQIQMKAAKEHPLEYAALTARDVFMGVPMYSQGNVTNALNLSASNYNGWSWDGGIMFERNQDGASTLVSNGYRSGPFGLITAPSTTSKMVTTAYRGGTFIKDYFEGRGICPHAMLCAVVRKFVEHDDAGSPEEISYDLTHKPIDLAVGHGSGGQSRMYQVQRVKLPAEIGTAVDEDDRSTYVYASPYQMAFFTVPSGSLPAPEYGHYRDEWGNYRTDGHIMQFGRLLAQPPGNMYVDPPMPRELKPLRYGRNLMAQEGLLWTIINPDEGGASVV